jgi:hypothetical protein
VATETQIQTIFLQVRADPECEREIACSYRAQTFATQKIQPILAGRKIRLFFGWAERDLDIRPRECTNYQRPNPTERISVRSGEHGSEISQLPALFQ